MVRFKGEANEWSLFVCRACGAYDLAREEIWHRSNQCPGRAQPEALIDEVKVVPKAEPEREAPPPPAEEPARRAKPS